MAASFACTIETQECLLDLMFVGTEAYCFTSGRGLTHVDKMLEILASVRVRPDKPFRALSTLVLERAALLSGCVCIFLSWDEERKRLVGRLKALGVPVLVLVITDDQTDKVPDPGPMKVDAGHFHTLRVGHIREGLAQL